MSVNLLDQSLLMPALVLLALTAAATGARIGALLQKRSDRAARVEWMALQRASLIAIGRRWERADRSREDWVTRDRASLITADRRWKSDPHV